ncbi:MAG TPA: helix-turn-helix domain-containing protein, partial [Candidatus Nanoarchaeia archaeon]|nr:helix-turn-helix domain-containing protein [Candidatus Nanoarchaeia archaeon]
MNEDFLKKLRSAFDLNIYEVKIWTALLSKGVATAGELSDIGAVPRSRSYDVLESLEKKGFVIMKLGKPIRYLAVDPSEIVKRVKRALVERANTHVKSLDSIEKENFFTELGLLYKNGINHID